MKIENKATSGSLTSKAMKAELLEAETELELARNWHYKLKILYFTNIPQT